MRETILLNELIYAVHVHSVKGTVSSRKRLLTAVSAVLEKLLGRKPTAEEISSVIE